ncbi:MAG: YbaB/EbfC family nucleoid-associated protein [Dehalococcoidia bacterium]|nr:YbaB/EbfC family nucleoid-associated protein [Dehalococcoidia bacterium]
MSMNRRMLRQAQELQKKMAQLQEELETATVEATAGGGVVTVVVTGKLTLESIEIDPEVVSPEDVEILQDLIAAAVNEGLSNAQEMVSSRMGELTGGLNIPGLT